MTPVVLYWLLAAILLAFCALVFFVLVGRDRPSESGSGDAQKFIADETARVTRELIAEYEAGRIAPERWSEMLVMSPFLRDAWAARRIKLRIDAGMGSPTMEARSL